MFPAKMNVKKYRQGVPHLLLASLALYLPHKYDPGYAVEKGRQNDLAPQWKVAHHATGSSQISRKVLKMICYLKKKNSLH